jgi:hypothetical protein
MTASKIIQLAVLISVTSCGPRSSNTRGEDSYQPGLSASQIIERLEAAYNQAHLAGFSQVFEEWNERIQSNSKDFIEQNDTIKAVFDVYREFYKPRDLLKLGKWEWGNELNSNSKYVVIENKLLFSIDDNFEEFNWQNAKQDSIINFRPPIDLETNEVLYLTEEYSEAFRRFLGNESSEVGEGNLMNPSKPEGESENRYKMIRKFIPVLQGHWGRHWHLETHPAISTIILNKSLTKSKVHFRVGYQGGETLLEKRNRAWAIINSQATWIE